MSNKYPTSFGKMSWACGCEGPAICQKCGKSWLSRAEQAEAERDRLKTWVDDLQSGMFINCVYCGFHYGPKDKVPCAMADALKAHVEVCSKHPMSALRAENEALVATIRHAQRVKWACGDEGPAVCEKCARSWLVERDRLKAENAELRKRLEEGR